MNVLIATQTYGEKTNGQGVFATHLAEGLAKNGHQVMVIKPSDKLFSYREICKNVCVHKTRAFSLAPFYPSVQITFLSRPQSENIIDKFQPDIVHIQDHYLLARGVLEAALEREIPLVATNHFLPANIIQNVPMFRSYRNLSKDLLWTTVLQSYNQVDVVTAPTKTAAEILRQQDIRVPVKAITCGVNLDRYRPNPGIDKVEIRKKYGLNPDSILFIFVGRIHQEKQLDVLVRAMKRLDHHNVQLAIVGMGNYIQDVQRMIREFGLEQQIVLTGFVPESALPALLNSADFFAMPSDAELQSIATLEALGTGLPVLAADARALPELVQDDTNGYLFEPGNADDAADKMEKLVDRRDKWHEMSTASLDFVRPHHLATMVERYTQLYVGLLAKKNH